MPRSPLSLLISCLFVLLLVACSDTKDQPNDASQITPIPDVAETVAGTVAVAPGAVLTPRPGVRVDLATARNFEAEGDIENAAAAYVAVAAGSKADRGAATLAAGRLLLQLERYDDARLLLEPFLADKAAGGDGMAAHYLLARAYSGLEMWDQSLQEYDAYIALARAAAPYADLDRSYVLLELSRPLEAAASAQAGLDAGVPVSVQRTFILAEAQSYERAGSFDEATAAYNALIDKGSANDAALALSRIVALKKLRADPTYLDEQTRLLTDYPATVQAQDALDEAVAAGDEVAANVRGLIYYRHNDYTRAEPEFQDQIDAAPGATESAVAYYYKAAIEESRGDLDDAVADYARVPATDPGSSLADDALWWWGRIQEQAGDEQSASLRYSQLVNDYPDSQFDADAAFRRGMLPYRQGDYAQAATIWAGDAASAPDSELTRLQFWQAKALLMAKQDAQARSIIDALAGDHEDDYVGMRALGLRNGDQTLPKQEEESDLNLAPVWDWASAETWLASKTDEPADTKAWAADPRWASAQELWRVGREDYGDLEVYDMLDTYGDDATAMYTLSRALLDLGRVGMSGRAGQRLLRTLDTNPDQGLPKPLLSLSYPAAFGPMIQRYADDEKVSPLLLLAFIRQESFFDPRAVSPVGALGLTQVLPDTAQSLAEAVGVTDVTSDQLLHADLNLQLGSRYMADQLQRFNGEIFVAFAAYNAGPTAAQRWRDDSGDDADLYLETVEFGETRLYVENVSENYAIYRYLYANEPEPNLPN